MILFSQICKKILERYVKSQARSKWLEIKGLSMVRILKRRLKFRPNHQFSPGGPIDPASNSTLVDLVHLTGQLPVHPPPAAILTSLRRTPRAPPSLDMAELANRRMEAVRRHLLLPPPPSPPLRPVCATQLNATPFLTELLPCAIPCRIVTAQPSISL
jgi:hypothetical protein